MLNYTPEFIDLLKEDKIRELLQNKQFSELYEEVGRNADLIPLLTKFSLEVLKINPLLYMDYVPYRFAYHLDIKEFTIPHNIIGIGNSAFFRCKSLTSITIPQGVTVINRYTFCECESLTSVIIGDNVKSIGSQAFSNCKSLTSIQIPDSVTSIGRSAFYSCTTLTNVEIPNTMTNIEDNAFGDCGGLEEIKYLGTKKEALKLGIGSRSRKKWREGSSIEKIICVDGIIEL